MIISLAFLATKLVKTPVEVRLPLGIGIERLPEQAGPEVGITATRAVRFCTQGTEFLGLKTERQNPFPKVANAGRDKNPELGWQKSLAETGLFDIVSENLRFASAGWWRQLGSNW